MPDTIGELQKVGTFLDILFHKHTTMKKILFLAFMSVFMLTAMGQDKMNKKMENNSDQMNKRLNNDTSKMNKKTDTATHKALRKTRKMAPAK